MKRLIPMLLVIAACSDGSEGGRRTLDPSHLRIVAGDAQTSSVAASAAAGAVFRVYGATDAADGVLPDTLITEIQGTVSGGDGIMSVSGSVELPPGTSVEYTVLSSGCGAPYIASVTPDVDAQARTLWEIPGARENLTPELQGLQWHVVGDDSVWASRCEMEARLKVGSEFRADTSFVAYFEPGPVAALEVELEDVFVFLPDSVMLPLAIATDHFGNPHPHRVITWGGSDRISGSAYKPIAEGVDTVTASAGELSQDVIVHSLQGFGPGWTYALRCHGGEWGGTPTDSLIVTYTLGEYANYSQARPVVNGEQWTYLSEWSMTGSATRYFADREPEVRDYTWSLQIAQRPGAVWWQHDGLSASLASADPAPVQYTGTGEACVGGTVLEETFSAPVAP